MAASASSFQSRISALKSPQNRGAVNLAEHASAFDQTCSCCPYGYHIDLDFLRFLESLHSSDSLKKLKKIKHRRGVSLATGVKQTPARGITHNPPPLSVTRPANLGESYSTSVIYKRGRNAVSLELDLSSPSSENSTVIYSSRESLTINVSPKPDSKFRTQAELFISGSPNDDLQKQEKLPEISVEHVTSKRTVSCSESSSTSTKVTESHARQAFPPTDQTEPRLKQSSSTGHRTECYLQPTSAVAGRTETLYKNFSDLNLKLDENQPGLLCRQRDDSLSSSQQSFEDTSSAAETESSGVSPAVLQAIREQMAVSLYRMKQLEDQVKIIPVLQAKISELSRENQSLIASQTRADEVQDTGASHGLSDAATQTVEVAVSNGITSIRTQENWKMDFRESSHAINTGISLNMPEMSERKVYSVGIQCGVLTEDKCIEFRGFDFDTRDVASVATEARPSVINRCVGTDSASEDDVSWSSSSTEASTYAFDVALHAYRPLTKQSKFLDERRQDRNIDVVNDVKWTDESDVEVDIATKSSVLKHGRSSSHENLTDVEENDVDLCLTSDVPNDLTLNDIGESDVDDIEVESAVYDGVKTRSTVDELALDVSDEELSYIHLNRGLSVATTEPVKTEENGLKLWDDSEKYHLAVIAGDIVKEAMSLALMEFKEDGVQEDKRRAEEKEGDTGVVLSKEGDESELCFVAEKVDETNLCTVMGEETAVEKVDEEINLCTVMGEESEEIIVKKENKETNLCAAMGEETVVEKVDEEINLCTVIREEGEVTIVEKENEETNLCTTMGEETAVEKVDEEINLGTVMGEESEEIIVEKGIEETSLCTAKGKEGEESVVAKADEETDLSIEAGEEDREVSDLDVVTESEAKEADVVGTSIVVDKNVERTTVEVSKETEGTALYTVMDEKTCLVVVNDKRAEEAGFDYIEATEAGGIESVTVVEKEIMEAELDAVINKDAKEAVTGGVAATESEGIEFKTVKDKEAIETDLLAALDRNAEAVVSDVIFIAGTRLERTDLETDVNRGTEETDSTAVSEVESAVLEVESAVSEVESAVSQVESAVSEVESAVSEVESAVSEVESVVSEAKIEAHTPQTIQHEDKSFIASEENKSINVVDKELQMTNNKIDETRVGFESEESNVDVLVSKEISVKTEESAQPENKCVDWEAGFSNDRNKELVEMEGVIGTCLLSTGAFGVVSSTGIIETLEEAPVSSVKAGHMGDEVVEVDKILGDKIVDVDRFNENLGIEMVEVDKNFGDKIVEIDRCDENLGIEVVEGDKNLGEKEADVDKCNENMGSEKIHKSSEAGEVYSDVKQQDSFNSELLSTEETVAPSKKVRFELAEGLIVSPERGNMTTFCSDEQALQKLEKNFSNEFTVKAKEEFNVGSSAVHSTKSSLDAKMLDTENENIGSELIVSAKDQTEIHSCTGTRTVSDTSILESIRDRSIGFDNEVLFNDTKKTSDAFNLMMPSFDSCTEHVEIFLRSRNHHESVRLTDDAVFLTEEQGICSDINFDAKSLPDVDLESMPDSRSKSVPSADVKSTPNDDKKSIYTDLKLIQDTDKRSVADTEVKLTLDTDRKKSVSDCEEKSAPHAEAESVSNTDMKSTPDTDKKSLSDSEAQSTPDDDKKLRSDADLKLMSNVDMLSVSELQGNVQTVESCEKSEIKSGFLVEENLEHTKIGGWNKNTAVGADFEPDKNLIETGHFSSTSVRETFVDDSVEKGLQFSSQDIGSDEQHASAEISSPEHTGDRKRIVITETKIERLRIEKPRTSIVTEKADKTDAAQDSTASRDDVKPELLSACAVYAEYLQNPSLEKDDVDASVKFLSEDWFMVAACRAVDGDRVRRRLSTYSSFGTALSKAIINMADDDGNTVMHYAISYGNTDIVLSLLDTQCCDVNRQNNAGYNAIMLASLLLTDLNQHKPLVLRLFQSGNVDSTSSVSGQTSLMLAASHGRSEMVGVLLEAGANVNLQDDDGSTALMCACEHGHTDVIETLLSHPDCNSALADVDGSTALSIAMEEGHLDVGALLYAHMQSLQGDMPKKEEEL